MDRRKISYSLRDRINTCSTIYDFEQLDNLHNIMANKHVSVVGGGFLGACVRGAGRGAAWTPRPVICIRAQTHRPHRLNQHPTPNHPTKPTKGTELALALAVRGRETGMTVSQIYAEKGPLCRYIPTYLGLHVQRLLHAAGVRYINERLVTDVKGADGCGLGNGGGVDAPDPRPDTIYIGL